jgi:hypothetical protein
MEWCPLENGHTGHQASGRSRVYLVALEVLEGEVLAIGLTRWLATLTEPADIAAMAARTAISLPSGATRSRQADPAEVQRQAELLMAYAEDFEKGLDIPNFRQWQHSRLQSARVPRRLATDADH